MVVDARGASATSDDEHDGTSIVDRLALIPASAVDVNGDDARIWVTTADLDRAAALAGAERPDDLADAGAMFEYLNALAGTPVDARQTPAVAAVLPEALHPGQMASNVDEFVDEVGWSPLDVSWSVEYPELPGLHTAMGGDFDEGSLIEAMGQPDDGIWHLGDAASVESEVGDLRQHTGDGSCAASSS